MLIAYAPIRLYRMGAFYFIMESKRQRKKPRRIIAECVTQRTCIFLEEEKGKKAYYLILGKTNRSLHEKLIEIKIDYHVVADEIGLGFQRIGSALRLAHDVLREAEIKERKA